MSLPLACINRNLAVDVPAEPPRGGLGRHLRAQDPRRGAQLSQVHLRHAGHPQGQNVYYRVMELIFSGWCDKH